MKTDSTQQETILPGIGVAPGIAIGPAFVITQHGVQVPEYALAVGQVDKEIARFQAAVAKTQRQIAQLKYKAENAFDGAGEEVTLLLDAYKNMLSGSRLVRGVEDIIGRERLNAEAAVQRQIVAIEASFAAINDAYLASRATDMRGLGDRLLHNLMEQKYNPYADAPEGSILIAEEITPADTAMMNPDRVAGFAAVMGGAEGHAAIMARALNLTAVLGVTALINGVTTGDLVILDGNKGAIVLRPTPDTIKAYRAEAAQQAREARKLKSLRDIPAVTTDGTPIALQANLELPREVDGAIDSGAGGIGLLRTEFIFMNRPDLPDEDEQYEILRELVKQLDGKPLTIRTLDVGGEKLATALGDAVGESTNPALGLRAIRLGLKQPKLLDTQLAAILRASAHGPVRILIPMVSSVAQMKAVRERLVQVERRLHRRHVKLPAALPPLGAMIEIPGAALAADALARVCNFFAIGSNDLTQYTLAIDRGDDRVADLYDPYHPAVLRLIQFTIAAAWRANIPVSLCGEMAGDAKATALLLGLGLREFSMAPSRLPLVKRAIRELDLADCIDLADRVMAQSDEGEIRKLLGDRG
jgi:phosphotransferase system enzyme I (PtsI)